MAKKINVKKTMKKTPARKVVRKSTSSAKRIKATPIKNKKASYPSFPAGRQHNAAPSASSQSSFAQNKSIFSPTHKKSYSQSPTEQLKERLNFKSSNYGLTPQGSAGISQNKQPAKLKRWMIVLIIALGVVFLLALLVLFFNVTAGRAFFTGQANTAGIVAPTNQIVPNTDFPLTIRANIGTAETVGIRFSLDLPTGVNCATNLPVESLLGWDASNGAVTTTATCQTNPTTGVETVGFYYVTVNPAQTRTGTFDVARLTLNTANAGNYPVSFTDFDVIEFTTTNDLIGNGLADPLVVVQCVQDTQCGGTTPICNVPTNTCVAATPAPTGCVTNADCNAPQICNTATSQCVTPPGACLTNADCLGANNVCVNNACQLQAPGCTLDSDCAVGEMCDLATSTCVVSNACGNGVLDAGETCDGNNLNAQTCASAVGAGSTGTLSCTNNCQIDISQCSAATTPSCTGAVPADAQLCPGDDTGLTTNQVRTTVAACTTTRTCEYTCNAGFTLNGGICTPNGPTTTFTTDLSSTAGNLQQMTVYTTLFNSSGTILAFKREVVRNTANYQSTISYVPQGTDYVFRKEVLAQDRPAAQNGRNFAQIFVDYSANSNIGTQGVLIPNVNAGQTVQQGINIQNTR